MQILTRSTPLAVRALCLGVLMFVAAPSAHSQGVPAAALKQDHLAQAVLDTLASRLGALESQRAFLIGLGRSAEDPDRQAVERQVATLRQFLGELPNPKASEAFANQEVLDAIEARLAGLAVERRLVAAVRPNHPDVKVMAATEAALARRRAELRALVIGANSGRMP